MSEELHQSFDGWDDDEVITQQIELPEVEEAIEEATRIVDPVAIQREAEAQMSPDEILKRRLLSGTGERVGRFVVQRHLDEGGMGLIFAALDEELGRPVALKILRAQQSEGSIGRARLLREAQALAKLSHPNVVTVYEVGEWSGHVYVAMELIEGRTLRGWLKLRRWGWRDVVDKLVQAGRGLAAAHKVGIIHRDFKPSNVLVGTDGRVRVLDFGLALAPGASLPDIPLATGAGAGPSSIVTGASSASAHLGDALTVAGAIAGTPAYMAPEQLAGRDVDARADQYAFCLTLFEGLYRERPWRAKTLKERRIELAASPEPAFPRSPRIPAHVRRVVRRGLDISPDRRYGSMDELLRDLSDDPTRRRKWIVGGAVAGVLLLGGGYGIARQEAAMNDPCADTGGELRELWEERKDAVRESITGVQKSYAEATWERLEPALGAYADAWGERRVEACHAHQSGAHDATLYGLAVGCLERRQVAYRALLTTFADADADVLSHAIQAADDLPLLDRCADVEALTSTIPPPEEAAVAEEVARLREALASARVELLLRRHAAGLTLSSQVVSRAAELAYRPLEAEALAVHGNLQLLAGDYEDAEATLTKAVWRHDLIRDDSGLAAAMGSLISCIGEQRGDYERAAALRPHADTVIERLGGGTRGEARLLAAFGQLSMRRGNADAALDLGARALAIVEELYGGEDRRICGALVALGNANVGKGRFAEAEAQYTRALAILEAKLGPDHPGITSVLNNLGSVRGMQGDVDGTLPYFQRALTIEEAVLGPEHPQIAGLLGNLGATFAAQDKHKEAREYLERSLAIEEKARGPDHPHVATTLHNLASVSADLGDFKAAKAYLERAMKIRKDKLEPDAPQLVAVYSDLGNINWELGRRAWALRYLEKARTLRLAKPDGGPPALLAKIQYRLAKIYRDSKSKKQRAQGQAYAAEALAGFKALEGDDAERYAELIATIEGWLADEPAPAPAPAKKKKSKKSKKKKKR
ncbi:MAG: serine/threonine-protein kinase [Nannocystaceae bacterium]